jgi:L-amino acid N-acyltransferase YncA
MIRKATEKDRNNFKLLWAEFLIDANKLGSDMLPTEKNLQVMLNAFDNYVSGALDGVVVIAFSDDDKPIGAAMCGELNKESMFDSAFGRGASQWGHYVREEYRNAGIAAKMNTLAFRNIKKLGFDVVIGPVLESNVSSMKTAMRVGAVPVAQMMLVNLKE